MQSERAARDRPKGEAQLTGGIAACVGSCGPGNLHLINGLYDAHARAAGAHGVRVEKPKELRGALRDALRRKGPALVDVVTDPHALSSPPKIRAEMVTGSTLSASKMVLDGGVGRMVQMARSNLHNIPRP